MTLLELLVGLMVTGLVLGAGYGALGTIVDQRERADEIVGSTARAAAVRRTLIGWLDGARISMDKAGPPFRGLDGVYEQTPDDELSFLTTGASPLGEGEIVVRLYVDRDTATAERGLVADISTWPELVVRRYEVEPRVAGLELRYFTWMLGHGEWLPSWISSTVMPAGVELTLVPQPGDTLPALLAKPIVLPLGASR
jgi:hypothetical protein